MELKTIHKEALIQQMTLMEDLFSSVVFEDPLALQDTLRILLDMPGLRIRSVTTQKSVRNLYGHSSVFDIWAEGVGKCQMNLEIQNRDVDDHVRRSRFIQGQMDVHSFPAGTRYRDLPELFLIFLTRNDFLGAGVWKVEVHRSAYGMPDFPIPNGVHEYYINLAHTPERREAAELLRYMNDTNDPSVDGRSFLHLVRRVNYLKYEKGGAQNMGEIMEQIWKMGEEDGLKQGLEDGLKQGLADGMKKGSVLRLIRMVLRMNRDKGMQTEAIAELLGEETSMVDQILLAAAQADSDEPEQVYACLTGV